MKRYTEYGDLTLCYEIEGDVDGAHAILLGVTSEAGTGYLELFDEDTLNDMRFICVSDFNNIQYKHYMATGETLND